MRFLYRSSTLIFTILFFFGTDSFGQYITGSLGKGISLAPKDSTFGLTFSARFQTLYAGVHNLETKSYDDIFLIRRARLKFSGFVLNPNVRYKIELGQSNRDTGGANRAQFNNTANMILDAVLKVKFGNGWDFWIGQTKLPGNRQRVVSSQKLQMVDRSLVNSRFNLDRDIGVQLHHKNKFASGVFKQSIAISMGEGRGIITENIGGYGFTGRVEYLPFGEFTSKGDYFEADLIREPLGKLSIGSTFDFNKNAGRSRGQLGDFMMDDNGEFFTTDLSTVIVDFIYKKSGFSLTGEFARKMAHKPSNSEGIIIPTENKDLKYATGQGYMMQAGYLFKSNFEISGRFTTIESDNLTYSSITNENEYMIGASRYFSGHSLKVQSDFAYRSRESKDDFLQFRLQVEVSL